MFLVKSESFGDLAVFKGYPRPRSRLNWKLSHSEKVAERMCKSGRPRFLTDYSALGLILNN